MMYLSVRFGSIETCWIKGVASEKYLAVECTMYSYSTLLILSLDYKYQHDAISSFLEFRSNSALSGSMTSIHTNIALSIFLSMSFPL